jgi:hypothetical protein
VCKQVPRRNEANHDQPLAKVPCIAGATLLPFVGVGDHAQRRPSARLLLIRYALDGRLRQGTDRIEA